MEDTAQWIVVCMGLATVATFIQLYKTGAVCFAVAFALAMFPHVPFGPGQAAAVPIVLLSVLPAVLTALWPFVAIVGLFVLANALFPSKGK